MMAKFVGSMFGQKSGKMKAMEASAEADRQSAKIAQARAEEEGRANAAQSAAGYGGGKNVRGNRLLNSAASGGLATTLGSA